ncbi:MAG: type II toxin-antitoxin system RelE/ParE family toxin [Isosphaeraceae bacterium]
MATRKPRPEEPERPPPPPPPLKPRPGAEFQRDLKRLKKRGKDNEKIRAVIETLCARGRLAPKHREHALSGEWKGWRDCHVEPDWIPIYREEAGKLEPGRTGTHADVLE